MDSLTYAQAAAFIYDSIDYERTAHFTYDTATLKLDRVRKFLSHFGDPHRAYTVAHVAGTKGKGSTAAMLSAILSACGTRTGLFTSPHLVSIRERIRIDSIPIAPDAFANCISQVKPYVESKRPLGPKETPTFFEILTVVAALHFRSENVGCAVFEVGLGGRLDSTNLVAPTVTIITRIGLDHTDKLGMTLAEIAAEKAGIIKDSVPVISAKQEKEAALVVQKHAEQHEAPLWMCGQDFCPADVVLDLKTNWTTRFRIEGARHDYGLLEIPLVGHHQAENCALAIKAAEILEEAGVVTVSPDAVRSGLLQMTWPARLQRVSCRPTVIIDGAHNPDSLRELVRTLDAVPNVQRRFFVLGMAADKDIAANLACLRNAADEFFVTAVDHPRAASADELGRTARSVVDARVHVVPSPTDAIDKALDAAAEDDLVCVTGSFYLAGFLLRERWPDKAGPEAEPDPYS